MPLDCIKGATILSAEESDAFLTQEQRKCKWGGINSVWWLRTPGRRHDFAAYVYVDGQFRNDGALVTAPDINIRPALKISGLQYTDLSIGDHFTFGDYSFSVISNNLALCDESADLCQFNENSQDGNDYETSHIKTKIDEWFNETMRDEIDTENGLTPDSKIADANDFGF